MRDIPSLEHSLSIGDEEHPRPSLIAEPEDIPFS